MTSPSYDHTVLASAYTFGLRKASLKPTKTALRIWPEILSSGTYVLYRPAAGVRALNCSILAARIMVCRALSGSLPFETPYAAQFLRLGRYDGSLAQSDSKAARRDHELKRKREEHRLQTCRVRQIRRFCPNKGGLCGEEGASTQRSLEALSDIATLPDVLLSVIV